MLVLKSLHYYIDGKDILKDISYTLNDADHLLICGPSGCGKSTLMHIMAGLLRPTSGSILFNGVDYHALSDEKIDDMRGKNFGFIFQKIHLIGHLTAKQNIELACSEGVSNDILQDLGIESLLKQKASTLSVGEAQRVALARALAVKPAIIFADEPTSALDSANAENSIKMLFEQTKKHNASLVVTSHDERIQSCFSNKLDLAHD